MDLVSWTFDSSVADRNEPLLIDAADPSRSLSYNQIRLYVRRLVAGFQVAGIRNGDCICVNSFNDVLYSALYFGIIGSGAIYTGVNPAYTTHELVHHLQLTKPKILIVEPQMWASALKAALEVGLPEASIYVFDAASKAGNRDVQSWNALLQHGERDWIQVADPEQTIAQYASTSGTSGLPKAAIISHSYHVTQAVSRLADGSLPYIPRRLTALPPFHVFASPIIPSAIRQGITTYVMRRFEIKGFLDTVKHFAITETYLPPPVLVGLPHSQHAHIGELQSLRQVWFGGASLKYANQLPMYALLHRDAKIQPVWGMTEAGWITAGEWKEKHEDDSVGRVLENYEIKIIDDHGDEVTHEGRTGDILVKGPHMMLGYIGNETATQDAFDCDGWLRTGDIGYVEDQNKVFVVDRKKDLMKVRGWQVSPVEVENTILQHPCIVDAAVIGVESSGDAGETPRAYIVCRPGMSFEVEELKSFMAKSLARYKIPEEFVLTDHIPKNTTGKVLRRVLRDDRMCHQLDCGEVGEQSIKKSISNGPWQRVRRMSSASIKTISTATRFVYRFLSWLTTLIFYH